MRRTHEIIAIHPQFDRALVTALKEEIVDTFMRGDDTAYAAACQAMKEALTKKAVPSCESEAGCYLPDNGESK